MSVGTTELWQLVPNCHPGAEAQRQQPYLLSLLVNGGIAWP